METAGSQQPGTPGSTDGTGTTGGGARGTAGSVAVAVTLYVGARLLLVAVVAGVLVLVGLPLLLALIIALVVALPLSLFLFRALRTRLNGEIDAAGAGRRAQREKLRAELRGTDGG